MPFSRSTFERHCEQTMDIPLGAVEPLRPTILLVEDDPGVRRSLQLLLRAQGYEVKAYVEGRPLLDDEQILDAACLITDYRLGDMDGLDVLTMLRARGWSGPAVLITAYSSPHLAHMAQAAGFALMMEKPLRPPVLVSTMTQLVPVG